MEVILRVREGPDEGREFRFAEGETVVVGRDDVNSSAKLRLSDPYMSRQHFALEVHASDVLLKDLGSGNGTRLMRSEDGSWHLIEGQSAVSHGDQLRAGRTVIEVELDPAPGTETLFDDFGLWRSGSGTEASQVEAAADLDVTAEDSGDDDESAGELRCIRCPNPLPASIEIRDSITSSELLCPKCREAEDGRQVPQGIAVTCRDCDADVSKAANADGRAADLSAVATYLCEACASKMRNLPSQTVEHYRLLKEIGRGGMGVVYLAWDVHSGRVVALKQMLPDAFADKRVRLRFLREQAIMQDLVHPNVIRVYEVGIDGGTPFFASEFASGGHVGRYIGPSGERLLDDVAVAELVGGILDGVAHVHARGYVHRDLKPENVLVDASHDSVRPKVCDMGLSRSYEKHGGTITRAGEFAGTICYMPPEQVRCFKRCGPPTDVYAVGVIAFYLYSSRLPIGFPAPWEIASGAGRPHIRRKDPQLMVLEDPRESLAAYRSDLPRAAIEAVDRATRPDLCDRFQTADEFRDALLGAFK